MTSLTEKLDPKVSNVGQLIGLLTQNGQINQDWFAHADTELGNIPRRVRELLQLTTNVLGKGTTPTGVVRGIRSQIPRTRASRLASISLLRPRLRPVRRP
jgi:hypothetical protein